MVFRRLAILVLSLVLVAFGVPAAVHAQGPTGTIPTGTTVEADAFLSAPEVIVDGNVEGDLFAAGESVTINGNVTGSVFLVASRATVRGQVGGSVYALAANLNLDETAKIDHSAYIVSLSLLTARGSAISRDMFTVSMGAQLSGSIARTTRAIIGPVEIFRLLMTQVESLRIFSTAWETTPLPRMTAQSSTAQTASACQSNSGTAMGAASGFIGRTLECWLNPAQAPAQQAEQQTSDAAANAREWGANRARDFVVFALIGLVLVFAFPRALTEWALPIPTRPWLTALVGLLVAVNGFILAFLLFILMIWLGILFLQLTLGTLTFITWTFGLSLTAAAFWLFILFLFYISEIVFATWATNWALARFAPKVKVHRVIPMLIGVFALVILTSLPAIGAIISLVAAFLGMGGIVLTLWSRLFSRPSAQVATATA